MIKRDHWEDCYLPGRAVNKGAKPHPDWAPVRRIADAWTGDLLQPHSPSWDAVSTIIEAARRSQEADIASLTRLLEKSNNLLRPLGDPLNIDFAVHRWLSGQREEVYSDWLAWVIDELDNPADTYDLFGEQAPANCSSWRHVRAVREHPIPDGRLDLVWRWPGKALLVVEVKSTSEDGALTEKQNRYKQWMEKQREPDSRSVLLVVNAESGSSEGGFRRWDWKNLCIRLRSLVVRSMAASGGSGGFRKRHHLVLSALMLGFVGAVEQNLLEMPGSAGDLMRGGCLLNITHLQSYLKDFHQCVPQRRRTRMPNC